MLFTRDESAVLVADKSGDVYSFLTERSAQALGEVEGQPLLGHLSMILDMASIESHFCRHFECLTGVTTGRPPFYAQTRFIF